MKLSKKQRERHRKMVSKARRLKAAEQLDSELDAGLTLYDWVGYLPSYYKHDDYFTLSKFPNFRFVADVDNENNQRLYQLILAFCEMTMVTLQFSPDVVICVRVEEYDSDEYNQAKVFYDFNPRKEVNKWLDIDADSGYFIQLKPKIFEDEERMKPYFALGHEFGHVAQFESGRSSMSDGTIIWEGKPYRDLGTNYPKGDYNMRPWEVDANIRGCELTRAFLGWLNNGEYYDDEMEEFYVGRINGVR